MAKISIVKCSKCGEKFSTHWGRGVNLCGKCIPPPPEKFKCPGCCICMGGWIPESERRY